MNKTTLSVFLWAFVLAVCQLPAETCGQAAGQIQGTDVTGSPGDTAEGHCVPEAILSVYVGCLSQEGYKDRRIVGVFERVTATDEILLDNFDALLEVCREINVDDMYPPVSIEDKQRPCSDCRWEPANVRVFLTHWLAKRLQQAYPSGERIAAQRRLLKFADEELPALAPNLTQEHKVRILFDTACEWFWPEIVPAFPTIELAVLMSRQMHKDDVKRKDPTAIAQYVAAICVRDRAHRDDIIKAVERDIGPLYMPRLKQRIHDIELKLRGNRISEVEYHALRALAPNRLFDLLLDDAKRPGPEKDPILSAVVVGILGSRRDEIAVYQALVPTMRSDVSSLALLSTFRILLSGPFPETMCDEKKICVEQCVGFLLEKMKTGVTSRPEGDPPTLSLRDCVEILNSMLPHRGDAKKPTTAKVFEEDRIVECFLQTARSGVGVAQYFAIEGLRTYSMTSNDRATAMLHEMGSILKEFEGSPPKIEVDPFSSEDEQWPPDPVETIQEAIEQITSDLEGFERMSQKWPSRN